MKRNMTTSSTGKRIQCLVDDDLIARLSPSKQPSEKEKNNIHYQLPVGLKTCSKNTFNLNGSFSSGLNCLRKRRDVSSHSIYINDTESVEKPIGGYVTVELFRQVIRKLFIKASKSIPRESSKLPYLRSRSMVTRNSEAFLQLACRGIVTYKTGR